MDNFFAADIMKAAVRQSELLNAANEGAKSGFADVMYDRLIQQIAEFEKDLDTEHEIGAMLASFGREVVIHIESIGYHNPYFIVFYGSNSVDGAKVKLVQHVSQINVLFVSVKVNENRPARRIGFIDKDK